MRYRPSGRGSRWPSINMGYNRQTPRATPPVQDSPIGGGRNARDERLAELEAILFLASQPMTSRKLAELAGLADGTKARTLIRTLNRMYDACGCAFRIEEVAGGFQMMSRAKFAPWLRRLHAAWVEVRLSAPAMETLAVVAYRQPILRAEIEAIRGVQSGEVLRQLIEQDLVRLVGRSQELGRPYLYGTSKRFLQIFGLKHIEELPTNYSLEAEEETNVKTLTITKAHPEEFPIEGAAELMEPNRGQLPKLQSPRGPADDEDEEEDDFDDIDDEDEEDEDEDEDLDEEEPWEEVEDEDEEEEEDEEEFEDEDEEDWDDEDWDEDDWDEDEDDWDEDEDEDEEEEEEK